jgi:hypothetical protein
MWLACQYSLLWAFGEVGMLLLWVSCSAALAAANKAEAAASTGSGSSDSNHGPGRQVKLGYLSELLGSSSWSQRLLDISICSSLGTSSVLDAPQQQQAVAAAAGGGSSSNLSSANAIDTDDAQQRAADVSQMYTTALQLCRALVAAAPLPLVCNNPGCKAMVGLSEAAAARKVCAGCRCRYCSAACQAADWRRHKRACKRMAAAGQACS